MFDTGFNTKWMEIAIQEAITGFNKGEVPVGAVIVKDNAIITKSHNQVESNQSPILHAEIVAITNACKILGTKYLQECNMYVTLEPCQMCFTAISYARISNLFYGTSNHAIYKSSFIPNTYSNILEQESSDLLNKFFKNLRNKPQLIP